MWILGNYIGCFQISNVFSPVISSPETGKQDTTYFILTDCENEVNNHGKMFLTNSHERKTRRLSNLFSME